MADDMPIGRIEFHNRAAANVIAGIPKSDDDLTKFRQQNMEAARFERVESLLSQILTELQGLRRQVS